MNQPEVRSHEEVDAALLNTPWVREGDLLVLDTTFSSFIEAIEFVNAVADLAEAENHHPDISVSWTKVRLELTTHQVNGLSERDLTFVEKLQIER